MIYIGSDHRGFHDKRLIVAYLKRLRYPVVDVGSHTLDPDDDYPQVAREVVRMVQKLPQRHVGILLCGSGIGASVAANKFRGIRAWLVTSEKMARAARNDDNTNILIMPADYLHFSEEKRIIKTWLKTPFSKLTRHKRRIQQINDIEKQW